MYVCVCVGVCECVCVWVCVYVLLDGTLQCKIAVVYEAGIMTELASITQSPGGGRTLYGQHSKAD